MVYIDVVKILLAVSQYKFHMLPRVWIIHRIRTLTCLTCRSTGASVGWIWWKYMYAQCSWWRHQMETFSALLALCVGNSPVLGEFSAQRPVTRSFDVFFDLRLHKRLSKQSWRWRYKTPWCPLWRQGNVKRSWVKRHLPVGQTHTHTQIARRTY